MTTTITLTESEAQYLQWLLRRDWEQLERNSARRGEYLIDKVDINHAKAISAKIGSTL